MAVSETGRPFGEKEALRRLPTLSHCLARSVLRAVKFGAENVTTGRMSTGRLRLLCRVRQSDVAPDNRARDKKAGKSPDSGTVRVPLYKNNVRRSEYVFSSEAPINGVII